MSAYLMGECVMGMHLTGVLLIGVYIVSVCLRGVHLMGVYLIGMHLRDMHLMGAYLMGHAPHGHASQSRKHTLGAVFGAKSSAKSVTDLWGAMISKGGAMYSRARSLLRAAAAAAAGRAYHCVGWHAVVCYGAPEWFRSPLNISGC
jgi:hypothetical protein